VRINSAVRALNKQVTADFQHRFKRAVIRKMRTVTQELRLRRGLEQLITEAITRQTKRKFMKKWNDQLATALGLKVLA
jgi:hypothetical protein